MGANQWWSVNFRKQPRKHTRTQLHTFIHSTNYEKAALKAYKDTYAHNYILNSEN